jgi:hypothetical protein
VPIQKCAILRVRKSATIRGDELLSAAHAIPKTFPVFSHASGVIEAEIAEKGYLLTENN